MELLIFSKVEQAKYNLIALTIGCRNLSSCNKEIWFSIIFRIIVSGQIKMLKQKLSCYYLNKYNLKSCNCLFIDDRLSNIEGANKCGIDGIVFESPHKLIESLKNFGIEI